MSESIHSTSDLAILDRQFVSLRRELAHKGLSLSLWGPAGRISNEQDATPGLCQLLGGPDGPWRQTAKQTAMRVFCERSPVKMVADDGPVVLGVPVYERRKLVAAAVMWHWPHEALGEEALHRLCDHRGLDYQAVTRLIDNTGLHSVDHADDLLWMLEQLVRTTLALHVATDDLDEMSGNLATTYEELSLVYRISGTMKLTEKPSRFLQQEMCQGLLDVLDVTSIVAVVYGRSPGEQEELTIAGELPLERSALEHLAKEAATKLSGDHLGLVENQIISLPPDECGRLERFVAVPMPGDERPVGLLLALNKTDGEFDSVDVKLMRAVANQAAVFLTNHRLYADLQALVIGVLDALTASIDAKDAYTCGHSRRVAIISRRLAEECGLSPYRAERVYLAGLLHDIGKIGVPESILSKPGRLTDGEFEVMRQHPSTSAKILNGIRQMDDIVPGVLSHHERMDGRGYPQGLGGEEIPLEGRIIGLADCFDALTSDRVYRKAPPLDYVIQEIRKSAGSQLDPMLVDKLLSLDLVAFLIELRRPTADYQAIDSQEQGVT